MAQVVRLDNVKAVYGGAHIHSVKSTEKMENGSVGVVGNLLAGERELREFKKPADPTKDKASLVAEDEIMYDQTRRSQNNLVNFEIKAGKAFRVYDLEENDLISVSLDAIDKVGEKPAVGNKVVLQASHKLKEVAAEADERFVGRIEALEHIGVTTVTGAPGMVGGVIELALIRVEKN
ncbi:hypothetical protein QU593_09820 [Rossellomorea marisflavi]|uniref:hypothetical protein n=1 Tax=Rossellomorea marisflavi TaxID=189381 RepID=UPI0025B13E98|nr:hypothetical protein [Rossellomorea marisflavi]WJV20700.1 hypothetical protein QU593_09820 [Rossellomorea marisflavi]